MTSPKLIIVEDNQSDLDTFHATVERYSAEKNRAFEIKDAKTTKEAFDCLNSSFDGAIIDLKLNGDINAGNDVIKEIVHTYRIPVLVMTGTPENVIKSNYVEVFKKGEIQYDVILDKIYDIYQTGLTRIFGGRGHLEVAMNNVFWQNILPIIETWKTYSFQGKDTEKALLRYTISHMIEALDNDPEFYFPEEMYIVPPRSKDIKTGSIVKKKLVEEFFIVLSPSCDLVIHKGSIKTDRIMICTIENIDMDIVINARKELGLKISDDEIEQIRQEKQAKIYNAKVKLEKLQRNSYCLYFHYLPKTKSFPGGFVNFRKIETYTPSNFKKAFEDPLAQVSPAFLKDIISRLSIFYARQGQPDFDFDNLTL